LGLAEGNAPFPWQEALLTRFVNGMIDRSLDIPTGLGKTAVMAIWLVARACGGRLPRRLVYVVDRRAVVDQATEVAIGLRDLVDGKPDLKARLGLERERSLPVSTLRGKYVDNREWLEDPTSPAIVRRSACSTRREITAAGSKSADSKALRNQRGGPNGI
jgi:CRISPR-associated endonuclease/helicase Cas3